MVARRKRIARCFGLMAFTLKRITPSEADHPGGAELRPFQILVNREASFDRQAIACQETFGRKHIDSKQRIDTRAGTQIRTPFRSRVGGERGVGPSNILPYFAILTERRIEPIC